MYKKEELLEMFDKNLYIVRNDNVEILDDGWIAISKFMISGDDIDELSDILPIEEYEVESSDAIFDDDIEIDDVLYIKIKEGGEKHE